MVFFTCFHCGDSVKKPAVEKHYNIKCKNEVALTCMDCLKDFDKQTYQGHTTCISEEQRYSGKDYVAKQSSNSGAKKQETWVDVVQSILQNPNVYQVTPDLKRCLQRLEGYDNVPRKKAKFENFVKNSFHIRSDQAEALWKLLEKALAVFKQEYEKQKSASQNLKTKDNCSEKSEIKSTSPEQKDLKSKRKKQENDNDKNNEVSLEDDILNDEPVKKKKKKEKHPGNNELVLNRQSVEKNGNENESTKKKKKERDQGNNESVLNGESVEKSGNENESTKKKKKHIQENQILESTENMTNNVKSKINGKVRNNINVTEESVNIEQFDWKAIIFKIVDKKTDGINIEKLKEKVLNKYKVHFNAEEISYKIEKTFNKKLKKISCLSIEDNIVKVKTKLNS